MLLVALPLATGCKSTPQVDWQSRVGTYTFDQAIIELGPPDREARLSDHRTLAQWITHRGGSTGFTVGTGFYSGPVGFGVGQSMVSPANDHILTLTFDTNNVLSAWSKNY